MKPIQVLPHPGLDWGRFTSIMAFDKLINCDNIIFSEMGEDAKPVGEEGTAAGTR